MPNQNTFDILLLIARPAAGKSEVIDYLKRTPLDERIRRFHIGEFEEIDDFPMLWTWFEEDKLLEAMGQPRLHTDCDDYFLYSYLWDLLIRRIGMVYERKLRDEPDYHDQKTVLIEFARGAQHGGWAGAFEHLNQAVLERAAVMYIDVSFTESLRKNRRRSNPDRPNSILEHSLSDEKMDRLYKESDWEQFSAGDPHSLSIHGHKVPYVVFENEEDVTSGPEPALGQRLEECLTKLWSLWSDPRI